MKRSAGLVLVASVALGTVACSRPFADTYTIVSASELRAIELANATRDFQAVVNPETSDAMVVYGVESDFDEQNAVYKGVGEVPSWCPGEFHVDVSRLGPGADREHAKPGASAGADALREYDDENPAVIVDVENGVTKRDYSDDTPAPEPTPCLDGRAPQSEASSTGVHT